MDGGGGGSSAWPGLAAAVVAVGEPPLRAAADAAVGVRVGSGTGWTDGVECLLEGLLGGEMGLAGGGTLAGTGGAARSGLVGRGCG